MKVLELIEKLQKMPQDADLVIAEVDSYDADSIYTPTVACFECDGEVKPSLKFVATKGSPHPSAAKVKPKWIVVRRRA